MNSTSAKAHSNIYRSGKDNRASTGMDLKSNAPNKSTTTPIIDYSDKSFEISLKRLNLRITLKDK
jgi:hypothetical protein